MLDDVDDGGECWRRKVLDEGDDIMMVLEKEGAR